MTLAVEAPALGAWLNRFEPVKADCHATPANLVLLEELPVHAALALLPTLRLCARRPVAQPHLRTPTGHVR